MSTKPVRYSAPIVLSITPEAEIPAILLNHLPRLVVGVEEHPEWPGNLIFIPEPEIRQDFYARHSDWLSRYLTLSDLFMLGPFIDRLTAEGYRLVFLSSCEPILANYERWAQPLVVEGYDLHPFQQFGLRRAFETDWWYWNWATGSGKSYCSAVAAKELFARGEIDQVIAFTVSKSKENLRRFFEQAGLDAVINDGTKPKRRKGYANRHQVYICNYEKLWVDYAEMEGLITGARTLFVFDECHRLVTDLKQNKARQAFERLTRLAGAGSKTWPMSASVVNGNPIRFHDTFAIGRGRTGNPLGTRAEFISRYADKVKTIPLKTKNGYGFDLTVYDWSFTRLTEIRHRVEGHTQAVRKTDPGVREYFRGLQTIVTSIQFSPEEQRLADFIIDRAREAHQREENLQPYYHLLRATAIIPTALLHTQGEVGMEMVADWDVRELVEKASSTKIEALNDQLEAIREQGDKALVFCHWTTMGIHLIAPHLTVPHVVHYGTGQTNRESQEAQDRFQADPDITCFLTSDAGSHGLNMTCARYVIQLDPTYSYDDGMQRASRIDRADAHLDGLANYVYVGEGSADERVWATNNERRQINAAVQGTEEAFSYGDPDHERALRSEAENMAWLIFG